MVGLWFAFYGFVQLICLNLYYPFTAISDTAQPSCTFYYYVTKTIISVVFLVFFMYTLGTRTTLTGLKLVGRIARVFVVLDAVFIPIDLAVMMKSVYDVHKYNTGQG